MHFEVNHISDLESVVTEMLDFAKKSKIFAFYGAMGAGKTTLIKQFCRRMQVTDEVNSPTFSIVNEYVTIENESIFHFDFYRINKPEEAYDIGYENYFYGGNLCLIEWPEKIEQLLPENYVKVSIVADVEGEQRKIDIEIINH
jgi:tRNA threonylcarbamoyladenosine biosynthesis protein TsaE